MLSGEQLIIVAYTRNDEVICRQCGENGHEIMGHALSAYEAGEYAGAEGLTCEDCGKEIIEEYQWTCPHCGREYFGSDAEDSKNEEYRTGKCFEDCPGENTGDEDEDESQTDYTVYKEGDNPFHYLHFDTQEEAEAQIAEFAKTDPDGVSAGMYSIDGPTE